MKIYKKYRNFIIYSIFGLGASILNVLVFNWLHNHVQITMLIANTVAWFVANLFSFAANKHIVFKSRYQAPKTLLKEIGLFLSQRLAALILDNILMWVGINWLHWQNLLVKIIDQLIVGLVNYFSTRAIFTHENKLLLQRLEKARLRQKSWQQKQKKSPSD
ncbi:GtrA family protein [Bombilactobacillus bombi]|uniref:GtrA family protein n=1 Tax=Bombilactobacillus bombi TaxID=1303590 RepID=UPI0015E5F555|nr:GtrA family protein [Bombilactobacillus bombi]MBA1434779.1 GtrA family protein [Bombilactobacillus bombi]